MADRLHALVENWTGLLAGVVFWCILWGGFSATDVLGGIVAVLLVHFLFPMPIAPREVTIRPFALVWLIVRFIADVLMSSIQVGWYALRPAGFPESSVVAVQLSSRSDFFLTIMAMMLTLVPGSVVVEAQRSTGTLFLHAFGAATEEDVAEVKANAHRQEVRLLRALARREILNEAKAVAS